MLVFWVGRHETTVVNAAGKSFLLYGYGLLNHDTLSYPSYVCFCIGRYYSNTHSDFVHGLSWHPTKAELITCGWDGNMLSHNIAIDDDHSLTTSLEMSIENEAVN